MIHTPIIFNIPKKLSSNDIYSGVHYRTRNGHKNLYRKVLFTAPIVTDYPVDIHYIFYLQRRLDSTNLGYMAKLIEDCIVEKGVLIDDSPRYVRRTIMESVQYKNGDYCEIKITQAE